ncbi:MAG: twin-arginine translocation signal domain-containing protein, partial [Proteiniphilum sp.]|nr:twin-arginine translocation signal domain-containing protein [Proteiniphilum sp.]
MHTERNNRRDFIKKAALASASIAATSGLAACTGNEREGSTTISPGSVRKDESLKSTLIVPRNNGLQITGAFLDEISHD